MKKSKFYIALPALIITIIALCLIYFINENSNKTFTNFYRNDMHKIDKIDIINGSNGNIVTITDKKMISDIRNYFSSLEFEKAPDDKKDGWTYSFAVYKGYKNSFNITFMGENDCGINDKKYKIVKSNGDTVESLYVTAKNFKK